MSLQDLPSSLIINECHLLSNLHRQLGGPGGGLFSVMPRMVTQGVGGCDCRRRLHPLNEWEVSCFLNSWHDISLISFITF